MFSRTTRLELIIVITALALLWFCSRPPTSGNAQTLLDSTAASRQSPPGGQPADAAGPTAFRASASGVNAEAPPATTASPQPSTPAPPEPRIRRIGIVDARNCDKLNYTNVMYGEITVRSVWDGQRFVPRKVCVVRESDGSSSVWTFDEHDNIKLSEIQETIEPAP